MTTHDRHDDNLLTDHIKEEMERYGQIVERLSAIEKSSAELVEIWTQAKGAVTFIKVMAALAGAGATIYAFIHDHLTIIAK